MKSFYLPINTVSFGQVAVNLLKEIHRRGESPCLFVHGKVGLDAYELQPAFTQWLQEIINNSLDRHNRNVPTLSLWHIFGLLQSHSRDNDAMTFHETSTLTPTEVNILSQQRKVFVTSSYTKQVFEAAGLNNVVYCPLGFDSDSFKVLKKDFSIDGVITFGLFGKLEKRKHTLKVLTNWVKKYGGNAKYRLNCLIYNQFMSPEAQEAVISQALGGKKPWNVNFLPYQGTNKLFNDCVNSIDIDLTGMSGCEGFNLPLFQSLCLGKHAVVLDAHVHKDFCNEANAVLVPPQGVLDADDGIFFSKGQKFNQGTWFNFNDDTFIAAMEEAEKRVGQVNTEGINLAKKFTYENTLNILLS